MWNTKVSATRTAPSACEDVFNADEIENLYPLPSEDCKVPDTANVNKKRKAEEMESNDLELQVSSPPSESSVSCSPTNTSQLPATNHYHRLCINLDNHHLFLFPSIEEVESHYEKIKNPTREQEIALNLLRDEEYKSRHDAKLLAELLADKSSLLFNDVEDIANKLNMDDEIREVLFDLMKMNANDIQSRSELALLAKQLYDALCRVQRTGDAKDFESFLIRWRRKTVLEIEKIERDDGALKGQTYIANLGNMVTEAMLQQTIYFILLHYVPHNDAKKYNESPVIGDKIPPNNSSITQMRRSHVTLLEKQIKEHFPDQSHHLQRNDNAENMCITDILVVALDSGTGRGKKKEDGKGISRDTSAYKKDLNQFVRLANLSNVIPLKDGEKNQGFVRGRKLLALIGIGCLAANLVLKQLWSDVDNIPGDVLLVGSTSAEYLGYADGIRNALAVYHGSLPHPEMYTMKDLFFANDNWTLENLNYADEVLTRFYVSIVKAFGENAACELSNWVAPIALSFSGKNQVKRECHCCSKSCSLIRVIVQTDEIRHDEDCNLDVGRVENLLRCDSCAKEGDGRLCILLRDACNRCCSRQRCNEGRGTYCRGCFEYLERKKTCSADGCANRAVKGGVCVKHGAQIEYKRCSSDGCTNQAVKGGVCIKHGARVERKRCSSEGCTNHVIKGGVCIKHGAKLKRCRSEGCTKRAQNGGVCWWHGWTKKPCSVEGCINKVFKGGVCMRHEGCTNQAVNGGVYVGHGAYSTPFDASSVASYFGHPLSALDPSTHSLPPQPMMMHGAMCLPAAGEGALWPQHNYPPMFSQPGMTGIPSGMSQGFPLYQSAFDSSIGNTTTTSLFLQLQAQQQWMQGLAGGHHQQQQFANGYDNNMTTAINGVVSDGIDGNLDCSNIGVAEGGEEAHISCLEVGHPLPLAEGGMDKVDGKDGEQKVRSSMLFTPFVSGLYYILTHIVLLYSFF